MYENLQKCSRLTKRLILLYFDALLIVLALFLAFALSFNTLYPLDAIVDSWPFFPTAGLFGTFWVILMGLSKIKLGAFEGNAVVKISLSAFGLVVISSLLNVALGGKAPVSVSPIFGAVFFFVCVSSRIAARYLLEYLSLHRTDCKRVIVYGAGQAGIQLVSALRQTREVRPVVFVDDNTSLNGLNIAGLSVITPAEIEKVVARKRIDRVILAIPSLSDQRRTAVLERLTHLDCEVQTLPSFLDILDGNSLASSLKTVSADDLLGRDAVELDLPAVKRTYAGKVVMVTGAGGSIGSELCRQLISCGIQKLVLFDHSEYALYAIERELRPVAGAAGVELVSVLGSVTDAKRVMSCLRASGVQCILHAAAYKHVPLVEDNEVASLQNNVLGTRTLANAALQAELEQFILISTDKAVRPTNVMGSSKRLAELVVQDFASRPGNTLFSMVRFGNVLGSSGSVIPLFQEQISQGGPVTLTHGDVTRYFMTISEAARLVLIAGSFAEGGDVFVLDMGKPVKILDLARSLIALSGHTVRDADNPAGDIEVKITGLRPGEKLYEELLIGDDILATPHDKIFRAQESSLSEIEVANAMRDLNKAIGEDDATTARNVIRRWVDGYHQPIVDVV
jgi:FlaA1/EpsC-like NDP-sugar epimerase